MVVLRLLVHIPVSAVHLCSCLKQIEIRTLSTVFWISEPFSAGGTISRSFLESLKGRLLYAAGHTYGRCTQLACQLLHRHSGAGPTIRVERNLVVAVECAFDLLRRSRPRSINRWTEEPPILIFTDGAAEENYEVVTHGAVMVDVWTGRRSFFGDHIPTEFVSLWKHHGRRQVISQAEMFPVLVAKNTWGPILAGRSILWFLDNESARSCFVRNYSPVLENFEEILQRHPKTIELRLYVEPT